jgi:hypothetical protein
MVKIKCVCPEARPVLLAEAFAVFWGGEQTCPVQDFGFGFFGHQFSQTQGFGLLFRGHGKSFMILSSRKGGLCFPCLQATDCKIPKFPRLFRCLLPPKKIQAGACRLMDRALS